MSMADGNTTIILPGSIKKAPSTGAVNDATDEVLWERSQSEVNLNFGNDSTDGIVDTEDEAKKAGLISEQAKVYWDLPEAVKDEQVDSDTNMEDISIQIESANSLSNGGVNRLGSSGTMYRSALETIPQREEMTVFSASTECLSDNIVNTRESLNSMNIRSSNPALLHNPSSGVYTISTSSSAGAQSLDRLDQQSLLTPLMSDDRGIMSGSYSSIVTATINKNSRFSGESSNKEHFHYHHQHHQQHNTSNYFCESDFDDTREQRPNYQHKIKALEDEMLAQLNKLTRIDILDRTCSVNMSNDESCALSKKMLEQCQTLEECIRLLQNAWEMPLCGRDCANNLCDLIRKQHILEYLADGMVRLAPQQGGEGSSNFGGGNMDEEDSSFESLHHRDDEEEPVMHRGVSAVIQEENPSNISTPTMTGSMEQPDFTDIGFTEANARDEVDNSSMTTSLERRLLLAIAELFSQVLIQENLDYLSEMWAVPVHCYNSPDISKQSTNNQPPLFNQYLSCEGELTPSRLGPSISVTSPLLISRDSLINQSDCCALLGEIARISWLVKDDPQLYRAFISILEGLLKHCESTCKLIVSNGGLRSLIYACRSGDPSTLRHVAFSLANLSLYGGGDNQTEMVKNGVADWLFPLAFHRDEVIQYYACLAIVVLSSNRELAHGVDSSGTLKLVLPFIRAHSPVEFARCEPSHLQGRSAGWLQRFLPVLNSDRVEARSLAAFHFAMEAKIKSEQRKTKIFRDIGAVDLLRRVASSPNYLASNLAAQALEFIGEEVPYKLSSQVPLWTETDVQYWLSRSGYRDLVATFASVHVDGDILLQLDDKSLREDIDITNGIVRKRILRDLRKLKLTASYRSCDSTKLDEWLENQVGDDFSQYTYGMLTAGVDRPFLPNLSNEMLREDCGVSNGVHRTQILNSIKACSVEQSNSILGMDFNNLTNVQLGNLAVLANQKLASTESSVDSDKQTIDHHQTETDGRSTQTNQQQNQLPNILRMIENSSAANLVLPSAVRTIDAFISYRRSTGSQLASLLKVHLQLRGHRVFLDIERLTAGKFDESLLRSVRMARNFILVLTPEALDRCKGDAEHKDWIHKEVTCALESHCNIIPVSDRFEWPPADHLPEDMRPIVKYNAVPWSHDYQDACVDKIEKFMKKKPYESSPFSPPRPNRLFNTMLHDFSTESAAATNSESMKGGSGLSSPVKTHHPITRRVTTTLPRAFKPSGGKRLSPRRITE